MKEEIDYKITVNKPFLPPIQEYKKIIEKVWETKWLTNDGPLHEKFKEKVKEYLKVDNALLYVNGHSALEIAIKYFDLEGEVITTPFTYASTTHAITNNDLTPVFCDIKKDTLNIDPSKIENLISEETSAIIPVHVFGTPCDVSKIREIANEYDLKVIYDAAHTFGVELNGKGIGTFGDISMFSLHATKIFHSIEGGILTFENDEFEKELKLMKEFGLEDSDAVVPGLNAKMNEFQAAMGLLNLRYIDEIIDKREKLVNKYKDHIDEIDGIDHLCPKKKYKRNYHYFPVLIKDGYALTRDDLYSKLEDFNIHTRKYFHPLTSDFSCYNFKDYELNNANSISNNVLVLPLYYDLKLKEVNYICEMIDRLNEE